MILTIAIKEWKVMLRNALLTRCLAAFALLFVLVSLLGAWNYSRAASRAEQQNKEFTRQWLEQGKKVPHAASHWGIPFVAAPPALGIYDPGVWPFLGEFTQGRAHEWTQFLSAQASGASPLERYAEMTPVWLLQYLLPLLAILLSYQMVAAERELGTARNLAALGVHPVMLLLGKATTAISILGALIVVLFAFLALVVVLVGGWSAELLPALALHAGLAFFFAGMFVWLSLCCSFFTGNGRTAAAAALGSWVLICFIVPGWITDRARLERLGPSRVELTRVIEADIERGALEFPSREERRETTLQTLLTTLGQGRKEMLPLNFPLFLLMEEDEVTGIMIDRRLAAPYEVFRVQDEARRSLASLSPLTAWRVVSPVVTGTDYLDRIQMLEGLERQRRRFIRILNRQHSASLLRKQEPEADRRLWGTIVPFSANPPKPLLNMVSYQREMLIMILWLLAATPCAGCRLLERPPGGCVNVTPCHCLCRCVSVALCLGWLERRSRGAALRLRARCP